MKKISSYSNMKTPKIKLKKNIFSSHDLIEKINYNNDLTNKKNKNIVNIPNIKGILNPNQIIPKNNSNNFLIKDNDKNIKIAKRYYIDDIMEKFRRRKNNNSINIKKISFRKRNNNRNLNKFNIGFMAIKEYFNFK